MGFLFLSDIKSGEVKITKEAKKILLKTPYRSGVQGVEIFEGNHIAWFGLSHFTWLNKSGISVHTKDDIKEYEVIKNENTYNENIDS